MVRRRCARCSELRWARGRPDESGRGACLETLAGVGRLGHEKLLGPAVSAAFQPPPLAQRIPRTPVAASVDTPERRRQRQVAAPVHLAPILGYLLALQA